MQVKLGQVYDDVTHPPFANEEEWKKQWDKKLNERMKSDIMKRWGTTDIMMNDLREFIQAGVEAGGADLARDIAEALKLMSNYAMGEYKKAKK